MVFFLFFTEGKKTISRYFMVELQQIPLGNNQGPGIASGFHVTKQFISVCIFYAINNTSSRLPGFSEDQ